MDHFDDTPRSREPKAAAGGPRKAGGERFTIFLVLLVGLVALGGVGTAVGLLSSGWGLGPAKTQGQRDQALPAGVREIATLEPPVEQLYAMGFSSDGKLIGAGDGSQGVYLYDTETGQEVGRLGEAGGMNGGGLAFAGPGRLVAVTRSRSVLWDLAKKEVLRSVGPGSGVSYAVSASGNRAVVSNGMGPRKQLTLIDLPGGQSSRPVTEDDNLEQLALSADGSLLASSGGGGVAYKIKVYRLPEGKLLHTLGAKEGGMGTNLAFSPDGKMLASCSDTTLKLWDVQTGQELPPVDGDRHASACCFSPDGKVLAAYHKPSKGVKMWDVASRKEKAVIPLGYVVFLAFSPKGDKLAASPVDKSVRLYDISGLMR